MFALDTGVKREALNYAVLMNVLHCTEHKLEPLFDEFCRDISGSILLNDEHVLNEYANFFNVDKRYLLQEFYKAKKAFLRLKVTDEIIKRGEEDYPPLLAQTGQAPRYLYIRGKKSLLYERRTVALVGSRQASQSSQEETKELAKTLGNNGITVVSGLAKGIDIAAHTAALDNGYNTISVLGTNLNQYYPPENKKLQLEIEQKGLVVSQFSPASQTKRWFFPLRNGVMSGLSLATVIMEAGETSGALKQADYALRQGRQVFIPKSALEMTTISWPAKYEKKGACVFESTIDILRNLAKNHIYDVENSERIRQVTMEDYLSSVQNSETVSKKDEWANLIIGKGQLICSDV